MPLADRNSPTSSGPDPPQLRTAPRVLRQLLFDRFSYLVKSFIVVMSLNKKAGDCSPVVRLLLRLLCVYSSFLNTCISPPLTEMRSSFPERVPVIVTVFFPSDIFPVRFGATYLYRPVNSPSSVASRFVNSM